MNDYRLSKEDVIFMREILKKIESAGENFDVDEVTIMASNILDQIRDNEISYIFSIEGSRVIEKISGFADEEKFEVLTRNILENLNENERIFKDIRSLFVVESLIKILTIRAVPNIEAEPATKKFKKSTNYQNLLEYNLSLQKSESHQKFCVDSLKNVSDFILSNLDKLVFDRSVSHTVRCCIEGLAGFVKMTKGERANEDVVTNLKEHGLIIPELWIEAITEFASSFKNIQNFVNNETSSLVAQTLCRSMKNIEDQLDDKSIKTFAKIILKKSYKLREFEESDDTNKLFKSSSSIRFFEELLTICNEKLLNEIYEKLFKTRIPLFCTSSELNFTIQKFINVCSNKEIFEEMFNAISTEFGVILQRKHTGIILALCKACDRLKLKQGQFIHNLSTTLDCCNQRSDKYIYPLLCLQTGSGDLNANQISIHGSLIMQHMLKFNKPIKIIQNILEMKPFELANILCNPKGSRVADAFMESQFIGEKNREKFIKHLEGTYLKLSASKCGAFVLEKLFNSSSPSQKEVIVRELSEKFNQLNGSVSGRILAYKFNIEVYLKSPKDWKMRITK